MEQNNPDTPDSDPGHAGTIVETSNFLNVLEHFDEDGNLIDPDTRFAIKCSICLEKNLAFVNSNFDTKSRDTHECFAVLPICGHAFGYKCITRWLIDMIHNRVNGRNPTCPSCREKVFLNANEPKALELFGDCQPEEQAQEVISIRESLYDRDVVEEVRSRGQNTLDPNSNGWIIDGFDELDVPDLDAGDNALILQAQIIDRGIPATPYNFLYHLNLERYRLILALLREQ